MSFIKNSALGALVFGLACAASAQPLADSAAQSQSAAPTGQMQKIQAMQQEIQQLSNQLQQIQQQAIEANPELETRQGEYRELVFDTMDAQGYEAEAAIERMGQMQQQLQSGELDEQQQQNVSMTLRQESQDFRTAQEQAMQDEAVQTAQTELEQDLIEAMKEQNPETEQLIAELNSKQQAFQTMIQAAMQSQSGGAQPSN